MEPKKLAKASVLAAFLIIIFMVALELYWRGRGFTPTHNDDKVLWAKSRKEIYQAKDRATIFVGGSRIKFDLDIPTWEKLTGEKAIQLALVGTPGRPVLQHVAADENFKGKLILDCAEGQFFSFLDSVRRDKSAREAIEYFHQETPAQKVSASINHALESQFVFLEEGKFGLTALLHSLALKNRPGINIRPAFPVEFGACNYDRQQWLTPMFLADTSKLNWQKRFWTANLNKNPIIKGDTLEAFLIQTKAAINRIRSRGGDVVFIRPPSNGKFIETENRSYPREKYWDHLLAYTNTPGIHFADYPETASLTCPELSHLTKKDAAIYTSALVKILREEVGWKFQNMPNATTQLKNH